ncbi:MAG TPA: exodeoxyribonuclease VII large subunit [Candidatus Saccharimonadia bacterium]
MEPGAISVSQFVAIINETLTFAYPEVIIEGEVSSFKVNQGKFVFFDLKDDQNVLNCFMMLHQLRLPLEDGMTVRVTGVPKVTKFSKFSLTARNVEIAGEGQLRRAMELLKRKLEGEGLFDPARKRPIPTFPQRIGLITSASSAAYADFIKILGSRWGGLDIQLADVSVQGQAAPDQLVGALEYFNQLAQPVDVVVMIRGGGSLEDLMAFSTEPVARAVAASRTPIIVGVGHEVDTSLADLAADLRAATPTDAARLVVPDRREILAQISHLAVRTNHQLQVQLARQDHRLAEAVRRLERYLAGPRQRLADRTAQLWRGLDRLSHRRQSYLSQTAYLESRLATFDRLVISDRRQRLDHLLQLLHGYNPANVLQRGYAIVRHSGHVVRDASTIPAGAPIAIELANGRLDATTRQADHV